jgi:hypothetical protein
MLECLIALPVLTLIFAGANYFAQLHHTRLTLNQTVRACAWQLSSNGCHMKELPQECQDLLGQPQADEDDSAGAELRSSVDAAGENGGFSGSVKRAAGGVLGVALGRAMRGQATATVKQPALLGGSAAVSVQFYVPCNLEPTTLGDIAADFWKGLKIF